MFITKLTYQLTTVIISVTELPSTLYAIGQTKLAKNRLVTKLPMLTKQFQISFDFKPTKWINGWTSILHFTTGANCCSPGSRIPAIFPLNQKLAISFAIGNSGNTYFWTPKLPLNKWVHFTMVQKLEGRNYVYRVYMDNKLLKTLVNKVPRDYRNVKVFVADPWYNTQPGFIKNIDISNKPSEYAGLEYLGKLFITTGFIFF